VTFKAYLDTLPAKIEAETAAVGLAVLFIVCVLALHVMRVDLDPSARMLSEYALSPTGWVMALAFFALSGSFFALAAAVRRDLRGVLGVLGLIALLLAAIGAAMGGLFPMDPVGTPLAQFSTSAKLHEVAFMLGGPGTLLAATFVNWSLARNPAWQRSRSMLAWTAALVWIVTVAFSVSMALLLNQNPSAEHLVGWLNRALVASWVVWTIAVARHSRRIP